jgi:drug/metabolite transporter (DMT)-like permease
MTDLQAVGPTASPTTQPAQAASKPLWAIGLLIVAVTLFSALDTVAKWLTTKLHLPLTEVVWLRFVGQTVYMVVICAALGIRDLLATKRLPLQLIRSVLMVTTTVCNFYALQTLRLDQTVTIVFLAPLVVAALAGPMLGEWVGWRRGLAIVIGFVGVLIAMHPGSAPLSLAVFVSLLGMLAYAFFMLLTRHLAAYDAPVVTLFFSMLVGTLLGAPLALRDWVPPADLATWAMLASLGALGGAGHTLFIYAYKFAPASSVSPFLYVQLLTMTGAGYLVFGDLPDAWTLAGAGIVIASGVYLVHREHRVNRDLA